MSYWDEGGEDLTSAVMMIGSLIVLVLYGLLALGC